jgi:hypothetical protein
MLILSVIVDPELLHIRQRVARALLLQELDQGDASEEEGCGCRDNVRERHLYKHG